MQLHHSCHVRHKKASSRCSAHCSPGSRRPPGRNRDSPRVLTGNGFQARCLRLCGAAATGGNYASSRPLEGCGHRSRAERLAHDTGIAGYRGDEHSSTYRLPMLAGVAEGKLFSEQHQTGRWKGAELCWKALQDSISWLVCCNNLVWRGSVAGSDQVHHASHKGSKSKGWHDFVITRLPRELALREGGDAVLPIVKCDYCDESENDTARGTETPPPTSTHG